MDVGDILRCTACGHDREVTFDWLKAVCRGIPGRRAEEVRVSLQDDLAKFACESCGSHSLRHLRIGFSAPRSHRTPDPTRIDEGIAGTREDNKRARARQWGEMVNRGKN